MAQNDPIKPEVGEEIRRLREEAKITQTGLAKYLNEVLGAKYHQTTVGRMENGDRSISLPEATVIAELLNVPVSQLADLSIPPSFERICSNYMLKIGELNNSFWSIMSHIRTSKNLASNIQDRIGKLNQNGSEVPKHIQDLVEEIPSEIDAYETMLSSVEKMLDHNNYFWHRWLSGLNSVEAQEKE
ncbi:helix-turn-helix domain-containing protein [Corynebacterium sp. HMSC28B08]|uniref:helix-turn-helix domain-containing protein n=1 Tax=Corynebacterium TaxID=1716 RepID=UPI0008A49A5B|nr:helix-turn-helix transcriptional regulator [Corynebacterium sp. HMSC28B08]OFT91064.1 hypothetical protein HMPREF3098_01580 [Corynebacterium sp. HMSC28B08]